jgi:isopentenyldiphosphate isomerase
MEYNTPREIDHPEEILDLVDENDNVIGTETRGEIYTKGLRNFRVVHALIRNSEGKLWIPRRVSTKKLYPNGLDYSIAGHVESGETYDEALHKEAREEANLDLSQISYQELGRFNPHQHGVYCFQAVYEIQSDAAPDYNKEDFSEAIWLTPEEIVKRHEAGEAMKEDIPILLKLHYLK